MSETKELIPLEETKVLKVFSDEKTWEEVYRQIEDRVNVVVPDLSKKKNRDSVISLAAWVTSSKTYLDKERKKLTADARKQIKDVNDMWKKIEPKLTALSKKTREPVTLWEEEEKKKKEAEEMRVDEIKGRIAAIVAHNPQNDSGGYISPEQATASQLASSIESLKDFRIEAETFEEFMKEALDAKDKRLEELRSVHKFRLEQETLEEEKKKLADERKKIEEKAEEERKKLANEKRKIEEEAAKQKANEEKRKAAIQSRINAIKSCDYGCEIWRDAASVKFKIETLEGIVVDESFEDREAEAALLKDELLEKLQAGLPLAEEADEKAAAELKQKQEAEAREKERQAQLEKDEKAEKEKKEREADVEHRREINQAVVERLIKEGFRKDQAVCILRLIVLGKIDHVTINY